MKAKHTTPPATVRRFNGGQFASEAAGMFGKVDRHVTNLAPGPHPKGKKPTSWAAKVHTHSGGPAGPEHLATSVLKNYGHSISYAKGSDYLGGKARAKVGGGHPRGHQG